MIRLYNERGLPFDVIQLTQNSLSFWELVVSIWFSKLVVFAVDGWTQDNGVVEQASA